MAIREEREFTQCSVDLHLRKTFVIGLPRPSDDRLDDLRNRYKLARLVFDKDRDLIGRDGRLTGTGKDFLIREVGLLSSSDRAAVVCLGETTEGALDVLDNMVAYAFDIEESALRNSVEYVTYDTMTKVQFSGPVSKILGRKLRATFARWADLSTCSIAAPFSPDQWPPQTSAMVHATPEYWEKYFGKDAPSKGFVVPADLDFTVYLPNRFFKMTKYRFRLSTQVFEDYLEHKYFVKSELPYAAHMELLNSLDEEMSSEGDSA